MQLVMNTPGHWAKRSLVDPVLASKSGSKPATFLRFFMFTWSSRYSLVHLLQTSLSESAPGPTFFFYDFYVTSSFAIVLITFCRQLLPIELIRGNRDPPSATRAATLYPKKDRVSRSRAFSSLNSRIPDLTLSPTTWWWCGCHDDVGLTRWSLTWWCGCHDGEKAGHDNHP